MTITLQQLRRNLGVRTAQPFFREQGGVGTATGGSTTTLVDTARLIDADDRWNRHFVYRVASQETRKIEDFVNSTNTASWTAALGTGFSASDEYEIWSQFTPTEVRDAINQALRDAWPFFFTTNESLLVIQNDIGTKYDLSSLSPAPKRVMQVEIERQASSNTGQVTSAGDPDQLIDANFTFTASDVGKEIRISDGTSQGDRRTIITFVSASTVQVDSAFTSTLDTTSVWRMVEVSDEPHGYVALQGWSTDKIDNPSYLRLGSHPYGYEGYVLRVIHEAEYTTLSAEADATTCPIEYIELSALARLYLMRLSNAPAAELESWAAVHKSAIQAAQAFVAKAAFQHSNSTWMDDQQSILRTDTEYPF